MTESSYTKNESKVEKELIKLGRIIASKVKEYKKANEDHFQSTLFEYRPVTNIQHEFDNVTYDLDRPNFSRYYFYEWKDSIQLSNFVEGFSNNNAQHNKALNAIDVVISPYHVIEQEDERKKHINTHVLKSFNYFISKEAIQDYFSDEKLQRIVNNFISDISVGSKIHFRAKIFLKNIYLNSDNIPLYKNVKLKRMGYEELTETTHSLYESEMHRLTSRTHWVNCFLEMDEIVDNDLELKFAKIKNKIRDYSHNLISTIRLCKIVDIHEESVLYQTKSIMHYTFDDQIPTPYSAYMDSGFLPRDGTKFYDKIDLSDVAAIKKSFKILKPIISKIKKSSYFEGEPHEIAFHRYTDALLRSQLHINRISYCLYSLDAMLVLYTEQKKQDRITHRTALIISILTKEKIEDIKVKLLDAYQIRSLLVHGGKMENHLKLFAQTKTKEIINYTRIILVLFLQISTTKTKEEFIDLLKLADNKSGIASLKDLIDKLYVPNI